MNPFDGLDRVASPTSKWNRLMKQINKPLEIKGVIFRTDGREVKIFGITVWRKKK